MIQLLDPATGAVLFTHKELACKASGIVKLADGFADRLVMLRLAFGRPMFVTSCCRSALHNRNVGGHPKSLHVLEGNHGLNGTAAIDIRVRDGVEARALTKLALSDGWSVGIPSSGFVHLDRRDLAGLPPSVFGYGAVSIPHDGKVA